MKEPAIAFQDLMQANHCYGCGADNSQGLQIKSFWNGPDETICRFHPAVYHTAAPPHIVNGGVIATVIDCHCIVTAMAHAYRSAGRDIGSEPAIWYATGGLTINYRGPATIRDVVELSARLVESTDKKSIIDCKLTSQGKLCADARVIAVRVPPEWLQA